jgi:hypothetical protein
MEDGFKTLEEAQEEDDGFTYIDLTREEKKPLPNGKPNPAYLKNCIHLYTQLPEGHLAEDLIEECRKLSMDMPSHFYLGFMTGFRSRAAKREDTSQFVLAHMDIALEPYPREEDDA